MKSKTCKLYRTWSVAAGVLFSLAVPTAQAQLQFSNPVNYPVGTSPAEVVVGDFNGDGKLDLAALNTGDQTISILLGNGDGTFQPATSFPTGSATASFLAVGDFNGDGKLDLAVANGSANTVSVMLGNGDGTFAAAVQYGIGNSADFVAVADFNNDKKIDLLVSTGGGEGTSNPTSGAIAILLGNGDGTFQAARTTSTGSFTGTTAFVAIGDFNGDGNLDVATGNGVPNSCAIGGANCLDGNVIVFPGKGDGTFQSAVTSTVNFEPLSILAGDFNGDGKADLVMVGLQAFKSGGGLPSVQGEVISTVLGNGDGTFGAPMGVASLPAEVLGCHGKAAATNVTVADLNGDGQLDLVAAVVDLFAACGASPSSAAWAFLGNGDGTFQPAQQFDLPSMPSRLAAGDFNGDTLSDVVVADSSTNSVSVLLNTTMTFGLTATSSSLTVEPGSMQSDVLTVSGFNGFANAVDLTCGVIGPTPMPGCGFSSSSVTPGASPATSKLIITAPTTASLQLPSAPSGMPFSGFAYAMWLPLAIGIVAAGGSKKRRRGYWMLCGMLLLLCSQQVACGGGSAGPPPPPQTYTVTVTAVSGAIQQTTQVTVTVP